MTISWPVTLRCGVTEQQGALPHKWSLSGWETRERKDWGPDIRLSMKVSPGPTCHTSQHFPGVPSWGLGLPHGCLSGTEPN